MAMVRITVLRKMFNSDLAEKYLTDGQNAKCDMVNEGDVFLYEGGAVMPKGFCPWAWVDIYRGVSSLSGGATAKPWTKEDGVQVYCCMDGVRPVVFLLEAVDG